MPKEMKYAGIIIDGKLVGRAENIYFPGVRKNMKEIQLHGTTIIREDDTTEMKKPTYHAPKKVLWHTQRA